MAQSVFIATPTINGHVDARYTASLVDTTRLLAKVGTTYQLDFEIGNSIVSDARNCLVSRFLSSNCTDLLFIDSDLAWKSDDVIRLLSWNVPLVGAAYRRKVEKIDFGIKFGQQIQKIESLFKADRISTGFLRVRRDVFNLMIKKYPSLRLKTHGGKPADNLYAFFDNSIVDGAYVGEDFTFCDRWRNAGGDVLVDAEISLAHIGAHSYEGRLIDFLERK